MRKSREADISVTRRQILGAANDILSNQGLKKMTVSAVARSIGMTHANVYRHFASREDLIATIAKEWMHETQVACETSCRSEASIFDNLVSYVLTARAQHERRLGNKGALDLYAFVLKELPEMAFDHHNKRLDLIGRILGATENSQSVIDALQVFIDPYNFLRLEFDDLQQRVEGVCALISAKNS